MCGRFTLKTPVADWLADLFPTWLKVTELGSAFGSTLESGTGELARARYNIAPSQQIVVAYCSELGVPMFASMRWGLVPVWADSLSAGYNMINARSESLAEKPSFRQSLISKRCVVFADGYYEWKKVSQKNKEPYWIHTAGERVFAMAGLWAENKKIQCGQGAPIRSAAIITTASNADVIDVHDRMPAILFEEEHIAFWLDPSLNNDASIHCLHNQLQPSPLGALSLRRVSTLVNSPSNDRAELLSEA